MILLSALLASLTGLVAGERPAASAQVELSAAAALAEPGEKAIAATSLPSPVPLALPALRDSADAEAIFSAPVRDGRAHLDIKQSWLI